MNEEYTTLDMLHDMRSPLAALMLNIEVLEKGHFGHLSKAQREVIDSMKLSVEKLRNTIDQSVLQTMCK